MSSMVPSNAVQIRQALESMAVQFRDALPSHITPEKFRRVVLTVINMQPQLARADKNSLLAACMRCAADGLVPDGRDAALVEFGGKVTYLPMYAGLMRRARNSGDIASISAHVVHARDEFTYRLGDDEELHHKPYLGEDRGEMIAVYAIARFKDGSIQREVLTRDDVEKVRNVSRAKNSGPWVQFPDQMWRKTAIRRLAKYLPLDADIDRLIRRDDAFHSGKEDPQDDPAIEGQVVEDREPDAFQQAASGALPPPKAAPEDELSRIRKLADESTTEDAVVALGDHPLVRKALTTGSKDLKDDVNALLADAMARVRAG